MLQELDDQRRYSGVSREQGMIAIDGRECLRALKPCLLNQQCAICWTYIGYIPSRRCNSASLLDRQGPKLALEAHSAVALHNSDIAL